MKRTWQDVEDLARDLVRRNPDTDPLRLQPGELRALVVALPTFGDEPGAATPDLLEAIQAAWYDEREG
jgi:FeS assembly protein IscX